MRQFIKFFTASCLGSLAALAILVLIGIIYGAIANSSSNTIVEGSILEIDLKSQVPERSNNVPSTGGFEIETEEYIGLHRITELITHAATDAKISGIVVNGNVSGIGPASLQTLRNALIQYKESDKFLYSFSDYYSQQGYYLSSVADSVFLNPNGNIDIRGFGVMIPFFKETMDKLGVKMNIFYAGNFKSATEPYRLNEMSPESKLQTRSYLDNIADNYNEEVGESRNKSASEMQAIADEYKIRNSDDAIAHGMADVIMYKTQFEDFLRKRFDIGKKKTLNYIKLEEYNSKTVLTKKYKGKSKIAVVIAEGNILYQDNNNGIVSDIRYEKIFDKILRNDKVKAVVLRVNSPGGDAFASDVIWHKIEELKADSIPVIASYGDYAASGGYYISCNADRILAQSNTITGSIGVFSMVPDFTDLLEEKIGIHFDSVKTAKYATGISPFFDLTAGDRKIMEESTDAIYEKFLTRVADGRGRTKEEIHAVAQGRVWTGRQAVENGLVDEIGDLDRAIAIAAERAGLDTHGVMYYPMIKENPYKALIEMFTPETAMTQLNPLSEKEKKLYREYTALKDMYNSRGPLMRMPFVLGN